MPTSERPEPGILLVDDTVENLRLLAGMLSMHGFEVRPVTNGRDALEAVAHCVPDLILLDVMMPDLDGFEVCRELRALPDSRDVPVIFLTAVTELDQKVKGFAVGGNDYITKPFQQEEVLARVANQLALQRARRELADSLVQLRELEQLRDDLVHMIVHDLRSPLSALFMSLEMMASSVRSEGQPHLTDAMRIAETLHGMTNAVLDVSRLEHHAMPLQRAPCDLCELAARVCAEAHANHPKRSIACDTGGPARVTCDAAVISRVLGNLLDNAVKHTADGQQIRVGVTATERGARVFVQDDGPGVPEELRERLFEKFAALALRRERRYHSTGLGLAFCKLAVEAHGGAIGVESSAGAGSTFWFELPA